MREGKSLLLLLRLPRTGRVEDGLRRRVAAVLALALSAVLVLFLEMPMKRHLNPRDQDVQLSGKNAVRRQIIGIPRLLTTGGA